MIFRMYLNHMFNNIIHQNLKKLRKFLRFLKMPQRKKSNLRKVLKNTLRTQNARNIESVSQHLQRLTTQSQRQTLLRA